MSPSSGIDLLSKGLVSLGIFRLIERNALLTHCSESWSDWSLTKYSSTLVVL